MDKLNLIISLSALIIAIATAFAAHYYYVKGDQHRKREVLLEAMKSIDRYKVLAHSVERERNKTGSPIDREESAVFALLQTANEQTERLTKATLKILSDKTKISDEMLYSVELVKKHTDGLSNWLEMLQTRFVNFNNNRVADIAKRIEAFEVDLEQIMATYSKEQ